MPTASRAVLHRKLQELNVLRTYIATPPPLDSLFLTTGGQ